MRPHPAKKNPQKAGFGHLSIKSLSLKSPAIIFIIIALTVFASEALVMMLLYNINRELFLAGALADATLLVIIISPVLYFLLFRPTVSLLNEREKSEQRFKTLAAATFEGIAISTYGKILDTNDQLTHILGYERHELIGKDMLDLVAHEDRDRVLTSLEAGFESRLEYEMLRKDGSRVSVEAHGQTIEQEGSPVRLTAIRDITERRTYEKEGRLAAALYDASSEAMVITDSRNRIVSVNPAFTEITGYRADEVLGKTPDQFYSQQSDAFCKEILHSLAMTNHWSGEAWDKKKDGQAFAASISISAIPDVTGGQSYAAQFSDITEKKRMEENISKHANFDFLTGLSNRRLFHELLEQEIKNAHRSRKSLALMFIDLDRFKDINDVLGHAVGDRVLIETARRIVACVRESDIVSRLGGDEFTVILSEVTDVDHIEKVADAIIHSLNQPYHLGEELFLSASIGITVYPTDATNPDDLIRNADQAMYLSKSEGRNCFHFFTEKMQESAQKRHQLAQDLYGALSGNQFLLHFQPIVDLKTGELFKAEALLRWQHPVRGMIEPAAFISVAEEIGVIDEIGDWVFKESLEYARRWTELIHHAFRLGVNISPVQFRAQHKTWINHVYEMKLTGMNNTSIEITEGTLLVDRPEVINTLLAVREAGMEVMIDDFGTGYSSLSYLQKFKIDYLKIDKSFIHNLAPDSPDLALSEAIIAVAHKLGIKVVAEGIETEVQRDLMVAAGCDFGQGYFFSKPVPREEFEKLLQNSLVSGRPPPVAAGPSQTH